jgi:hypothetical protein
MHAFSIGMVFSLLIVVLILFVYVSIISFMIWMVVDAAKNDKILWVLIIVGLPVVGSIIYYFTEKKEDWPFSPHHKKHEHHIEA